MVVIFCLLTLVHLSEVLGNTVDLLILFSLLIIFSGFRLVLYLTFQRLQSVFYFILNLGIF